MAVERDIKAQRVRRWERKRGQDDRDRRLRELMKRKKAAQKRELASSLLLQEVPEKHRTPGCVEAVAVLWEAVQSTKLLKRSGERRAGWPMPDASYLYGLGQLSVQHRHWVRSPAGWVPRTHNVERQFASLAAHLFCRYPVPACFGSAWFNRSKRSAAVEQRWYIRLGQGKSLRGAPGLPLELTRRAAHLLQEAPATLTILQALRWAQLRAMGADDRLVTVLLESPMGTNFRRDAFWLTVARFFVAHPMLDRAQVGPIVDYLHDRRHRAQPAMLVEGRLVEPGPAQPNLSMQGRSPETLLRQVRQWHGRLARGSVQHVPRSWKPCGIAGLSRVEGTGRRKVLWRVRELCDSRELLAEGRAMRHCVASYADSCARGFSAIYSMTRTTEGGVEPVLTLEVVVAGRRIVQARGRCNELPTPEARRVMQVWARHAGLVLGMWV
ncbi:MAG: PcfJ domain-containing protein [Planctomycetota bacterium]